MAKEYTGEVILSEPKEYTGDIIYDVGAIQTPTQASDIPQIRSPEEQAIAEKKWRDYQNSFSHKAGEFAEEGLRMLEGLPMLGPEVNIGEGAIPYVINQIPALEQGVSTVARHMPDITKVTAHPLYKKAMGAVEPVIEGAKNVKEKTSDFLKSLPLNTQAFLSGKPKEELKAMYEIGKEKSGKLLKEFNNWANNEFVNILNRGDYNTAIAEGLPHELAIQATHRRSDLEKGVWYLKNLFNNNYVAKMGISPEQFKIEREALMQDILPKAVSEARRLGMKYGDIVPTNIKDFINTSAHSAGYGGLGAMILHGLAGAKAGFLPWITHSPRLNAEIAIGAGKASRYAKPIANAIPTILKGTKDIPTPALVGGLNYLRGDEED